MRIYYDTEFLEDGRTIDLISIGMVAADGRELYLINEGVEEDPLYTRIRRDRWLMDNVVRHLPLRNALTMPDAQFPGHFRLDTGDNRIVSLRYIRNAVREFILGTDQPELWADYGAYDHIVLAQLFGRMVSLPKGIPMWTNDLRQEITRLDVTEEELPKQETDQHNALADAQHARRLGEYLIAVERHRAVLAEEAIGRG